MHFSRHTPWGYADHVEDLGRGLMSVSTAGHGGLFVPDELLHCIPPKQREWAKRWSGSENWYEEDACWSAVAVAFPDRFAVDVVESARSTLDAWFTKRYLVEGE